MNNQGKNGYHLLFVSSLLSENNIFIVLYQKKRTFFKSTKIEVPYSFDIDRDVDMWSKSDDCLDAKSLKLSTSIDGVTDGVDCVGMSDCMFEIVANVKSVDVSIVIGRVVEVGVTVSVDVGTAVDWGSTV